MEAQHTSCRISHPSLVKWVPRKDLIRASLDTRNGQGFSYGSSELIALGTNSERQRELRKSNYKSLENVIGTRRITDLVFESLAQETLQNEIKL